MYDGSSSFSTAGRLVVPIKEVSVKYVTPEEYNSILEQRDKDRRLVIGLNAYGQRSLYWHSNMGYTKIETKKK